MKSVNLSFEWENSLEVKYVIFFSENAIYVGSNKVVSHFLAFKSEELRNKFLEHFRDLIMEAKPLL